MNILQNSITSQSQIEEVIKEEQQAEYQKFYSCTIKFIFSRELIIKNQQINKLYLLPKPSHLINQPSFILCLCYKQIFVFSLEIQQFILYLNNLHESNILCSLYFPDLNILVTGGFDYCINVFEFYESDLLILENKYNNDSKISQIFKVNKFQVEGQGKIIDFFQLKILNDYKFFSLSFDSISYCYKIQLWRLINIFYNNLKYGIQEIKAPELKELRLSNIYCWKEEFKSLLFINSEHDTIIEVECKQSFEKIQIIKHLGISYVNKQTSCIQYIFSKGLLLIGQFDTGNVILIDFQQYKLTAIIQFELQQINSINYFYDKIFNQCFFIRQHSKIYVMDSLLNLIDKINVVDDKNKITSLISLHQNEKLVISTYQGQIFIATKMNCKFFLLLAIKKTCLHFNENIIQQIFQALNYIYYIYK